MKHQTVCVVPDQVHQHLIRVAHQQNCSVSSVVERVLTSWSDGETTVRYYAGKNQSVNSVRRALLTSPMMPSEISLLLGFSMATIRSAIIRLQGSGEIEQNYRGSNEMPGRPGVVWSMTERGRVVASELKLEPVTGKFSPPEADYSNTPRGRILAVFKSEPERDFTIRFLVNETKHGDSTVRAVVDSLVNAGLVRNSGRAGYVVGKPAFTYRLADRQEAAAPVAVEREPERVSMPEPEHTERDHFCDGELQPEEEDEIEILAAYKLGYHTELSESDPGEAILEPKPY